MTPTESRQLPKYKCHKEVHAIKIKDIINKESGASTIIPLDEGYLPIQVTKEYMQKHTPKVGGYYVVYKDGYESFSPSEAFEDGYSKL